MSKGINNWMKWWRYSYSLAQKKASKKFLRLLLSLSIVLIIYACGGAASNQSKLSTSELSSTSCRVIQHVVGETCIPNNPQRVAILLHHILGHVLVLDVKPAGSNIRSLEQADGYYLSTQTYMGSKTEGIQLLGIEEQTNLEKILSLKPDLILTSEYSEDMYSQLSQISPVVTFQYEDVVLNWKEGFNSIAEALGKEEKAQQALDHYYQQIEKLKTALGDQYQDQTISIVGGSSYSLVAFTQSSFSASILSDLGLKQPEAQNIVTPNGAIYNLSEEKWDQVDGDVLFFLSFGQEGRVVFEGLQQRPLWKSLKAAQKGQVYLVDGYTWTGSNLLAADAVINDLYKYLVNTP